MKRKDSLLTGDLIAGPGQRRPVVRRREAETLGKGLAAGPEAHHPVVRRREAETLGKGLAAQDRPLLPDEVPALIPERRGRVGFDLPPNIRAR